MFTEEQVPELLAQLTLEEKCSLLSGSDFWHTQPIERLEIPALMVSDGPHGLRKQAEGADDMGLEESVPATCFPTAAALASTWDAALLGEVGRALAEEAKTQGVGVILGPGVNLKRSPLCGRNFEYFSEDPFLAGELAAALVSGIESEGVGTSLKHFAANNQETDRMRINARIDERTLREMYLSIFERIIEKARPATLMCSYNRINNTYSSENHWLLTEVLRDEWGFDGLVMTDWGAVHDRAAGVAAGLDLEMPSSRGWNDQLVAEAVRVGALAESDLDRVVTRVLQLVARYHREMQQTSADSFDPDAHHELACRVATRSAVLLKNEDTALPLLELDDVVVIGEMARTPRYQGAGSSQVNPTRLDSALNVLRRRYPGLPFEPGYPLPGSPVADSPAEHLLRKAQSAASCRTVLLFLGLPAEDESEGYDRQHISLPANHVALLHAVRRTADTVIVLLSNGAAVETASWEADADAILELWLGGQGCSEAVARLVTGEESPSGRLAETIPVKLEQHPSQLNFPGEAGEVRYGEGIFVGYRGLQQLGNQPSYPFGHGLTYTTFEFSDLQAELATITDGMSPGDTVLTTRFAVTNTGDRSGVAVPQLYLGYPDSTVVRPLRELRGFRRVELEPGETTDVEVQVSRRELSFWDVHTHSWRMEPGRLRIEIGVSVEDIKLCIEKELSAPPLLPPLTEWSTVTEWKRRPAAWEKLRPFLASFGKESEFFLLDLPVCKLPLMFEDTLTFDQLAELLVEVGTTPYPTSTL